MSQEDKLDLFQRNSALWAGVGLTSFETGTLTVWMA
jgi:hypothetical protein